MSADGMNDLIRNAFRHWCESCGREALLDSRDAYEAGWDFPPHIGTWGVISPRTCPDCKVEMTVWWAITVEKRSIDEMTPQQRKAVGRILDEVSASGTVQLTPPQH